MALVSPVMEEVMKGLFLHRGGGEVIEEVVKVWQEVGCRTAQELLVAASQGSFPWQEICLGKGLEAGL